MKDEGFALQPHRGNDIARYKSGDRNVGWMVAECRDVTFGSFPLMYTPSAKVIMHVSCECEYEIILLGRVYLLSAVCKLGSVITSKCSLSTKPRIQDVADVSSAHT